MEVEQKPAGGLGEAPKMDEETTQSLILPASPCSLSLNTCPGTGCCWVAWGANLSIGAAATSPARAGWVSGEAWARRALLNCSAGRCHKQAGTWQTHRFPRAYRAATSAQLPGYFNM